MYRPPPEHAGPDVPTSRALGGPHGIDPGIALWSLTGLAEGLPGDPDIRQRVADELRRVAELLAARGGAGAQIVAALLPDPPRHG